MTYQYRLTATDGFTAKLGPVWRHRWQALREAEYYKDRLERSDVVRSLPIPPHARLTINMEVGA